MEIVLPEGNNKIAKVGNNGETILSDEFGFDMKLIGHQLKKFMMNLHMQQKKKHFHHPRKANKKGQLLKSTSTMKVVH